MTSKSENRLSKHARHKPDWANRKAKGKVSQVISTLLTMTYALSIALTPAVALAQDIGGTWIRQPLAGLQDLSAGEIAAPPDDLYSGVLDNVLAMMDDYDSMVPSLDMLADRFGTDAEAAFVFVRDTIRTEPYVGTLRDPVAVIAASGGNPQDKAELLMTLLRKMGYDARVATAPMDDTIAGRLASAGCGITPAADPYLNELMGMTPATMQQAIARAQRDYGLLTDAALADVAAAGSLSTNFGPTYAWVQYRSTDGWRDLDPAVGDLVAGEALATATGLSEGGDAPHTVTISIVTETVTEGRLREREVLTHALNARDVANSPIQLAFVPAAAGQGGALADKLSEAIDLAPRMKPALVIDWDVILGSDFAQPGPMTSGGLTGPGTEDPVTAIYLDITSVAPEGETRTARRNVIDLLPAEARNGDAIGPELILSPTIGTRYPEDLEGALQVIVSNGGLNPADHTARLLLIITSVEEITTKLADGTIQPDSLVWFAWTAAHGLATGAERAMRDATSAQGDICTFIGHPNVMLWGTAPRGDAGIATWLDWAIDGIDVTSSSATPDPQEVAALRVWYGAVRGSIETEALRAFFGSDLGGPDQQFISTSAMLNGPLTRLTEADIAQLGARDAAADLGEGYALYGIAGRMEGPAVWWRVDPDSGSTDARVAGLGNFSFWWSGNYVNAAGSGGISQLNAAYGQYANGEISRRQLIAKLNAEKARARVRAAGRARTPAGQKGGNNEYLVTLTVAIVGGTVLATVAGLVVYTHFYAAIYGPPQADPEDPPEEPEP